MVGKLFNIEQVEGNFLPFCLTLFLFGSIRNSVEVQPCVHLYTYLSFLHGYLSFCFSLVLQPRINMLSLLSVRPLYSLPYLSGPHFPCVCSCFCRSLVEGSKDYILYQYPDMTPSQTLFPLLYYSIFLSGSLVDFFCEGQNSEHLRKTQSHRLI